jgi:hypothetical protein
MQTGGKIVKTIEISQELYDRLKNFVVDPFDDSPEIVISRLIDIVDKARSLWSSWDASEEAGQQSQSQSPKTKRSTSGQEQVGVLL